MPLFNASTLTLAQAKQRIASVTGAELFPDQLVRAGYALEEAWRFWENSRDWRYLLTTTTNTVVGDITAGTIFTLATPSESRKIAVGMTVTGDNVITTPTRVTAVVHSSGTIAVTPAMTNGTSESLTFQIEISSGTSEYTLPTQVKKPYTARLTQNNPRTLVYVDQRLHDYVDPSQTSSGVPVWYKLQNLHDTGKITLYPANTVSDTLLVKYYRRHVVPEALQDGTTADDSDALDFPAQYQTALLAAARVIYMADKGGGPPERLQYWMMTAQQMTRQAIAEDEFLPDGDQGFIPAIVGYSTPFVGPNDLRPWLDY